MVNVETRLWYSIICNEDEIDRIINMKTADDYLLKVRADEILKTSTLYKSFAYRRREKRGFTNLKDYFNDGVFEYYLGALSDEDRQLCKSVPRGTVFSNDPNAQCIKTDFGNIITISESLQYFLFFMNLYFYDHWNIPEDAKGASLLIALRTMLKTEALDFDIDPRGNIPWEIQGQNEFLVSEQLQFIVGHEFAHHLLGHLSSGNIIEKPLLNAFQSEPEGISEKFYTYHQKQEFEADIDALTRPNYHQDLFEFHVHHAMTFFNYIDIYESISAYFFGEPRYKRHPDPIDRLWNIFDLLNKQANLNKKGVELRLEQSKRIKEFLIEDVAVNIERYENFGSVYLGQWKE